MKKLVAIICAMVSCFAFIGCGRQIQKFDPNKTQIFVSYYTGGYGSAWIDQAALDFNKTEDKYEVVISPDKNSSSGIMADLGSGKPSSSIYFSVASNFREAINANLVADISDVLKMKVDGNDVAISDKIENFELWKEVGAKNGEGFYLMPNSDSVVGYVFDYDLFVENKWLLYAENSATVKAELDNQGIEYTASKNSLKFEKGTKTNYKKGDVILSKGKDGKYGTYDDGQPITESEWLNMIGKITSDGTTPFIWTGKFDDYTSPIVYAMFAQYEGIENYNSFFSYKNYKNANNENVNVDAKTGYKVYQMDGIKKSLEFMEKYFTNEKWHHPCTGGSEVSHKNAQENFLLGYKNTVLNPQSAMLVEGAWWEYEALETFKAIAADGRPERNYGKRNYRYMLLPQLEGSKGANGDGTGSVMAAHETGAALIAKNQSEDMLEMSKKFLAFTCKDEYLKQYALTTGARRPFKLSLTEDEIKTLTPFAQNVYQIYEDKKNVTIIRPGVDNLISPINYASSKSDFIFATEIGSEPYNIPLTGLKRYSSQQYFDGMQTLYTNKWNVYYNEVKTFFE